MRRRSCLRRVPIRSPIRALRWARIAAAEFGLPIAPGVQNLKSCPIDDRTWVGHDLLFLRLLASGPALLQVWEGD